MRFDKIAFSRLFKTLAMAEFLMKVRTLNFNLNQPSLSSARQFLGWDRLELLEGDRPTGLLLQYQVTWSKFQAEFVAEIHTLALSK